MRSEKAYRSYRVYLNCFEDAPYIWSVDSGSTESEIHAKDVILLGCSGDTRSNLHADNEREPRAWISVSAYELMVREGIAILRG